MLTSRTRGVIACMVIVVVAVGGQVPRGSAQVSSPFSAFASADGVSIVATNPSFPLGLETAGPGPNATTLADSLGTSDATASFPHLGAGIQGLPGLAAGLFGVPIPSYPLQASVNAGQAPSNVAGPGFSLHAESGERRTNAAAVAGTDALGASTNSTIERRDNGDIVARATSSVNLLDLAGIVSMRGVESSVEVIADSSTREIERRSSMSIGSITAPGLAITLPEKTPGQIGIPNPIPGLPQVPVIELPEIPVPLGGQTLQAPSIGFRNGSFTVQLPLVDGLSIPVDTGLVISAFHALGIDLSIQDARQSASGMTALTLVVRYEVPPNDALPDPTPVELTLGSATAYVDIHPASAAPDPFIPDIESGSGASAVGPTPPTAPSAGTSGIPSTPAQPDGSEHAAASAPLPLPTANIVPVAIEATLLYPVLVAACFAMVAASFHLRLKGVRSVWDS